jgi:hypothetical protein
MWVQTPWLRSQPDVQGPQSWACLVRFTHRARAACHVWPAHTGRGVQNHRFTFNEAMPVESCTQSLCDLALRFGEDGQEESMVRRSLVAG